MKKIIFIFVISIFTNYSFAKDLSGNAVECYKKYDREHHGGLGNPSYTVNDYYHANIKFLTKNKVTLALAIFSDEKIDFKGNKISEKEFKILLPENTFKYKVEEKVIVIKMKNNIQNLYDPSEHLKKLVDKKGGEIWIYRENLNLIDPVITARLNLAGNPLKCKLVDFDDASLFEKYTEFNNLLLNLKKGSKSKNIL